MLGRHLFIVLLVGYGTLLSARDKSDTIQLLNGDRITGEIKQLEHGRLRVSTDAMGTIQVEWNDIAAVVSAYEFEFELTDGKRYYGRLPVNQESARLAVATDAGRLAFAFARVVRITPIEKTFWEGLDGSMSFGYSFTKASEVSQFSFGGSATYRTPRRAFTLNTSTIVIRDADDKTTQREDLNLRIIRFRQNRWFSAWLGGLERNDELGLDLRLSLGGGIGRYLIQTNISELALVSGVIATRESQAGDAESEQNVEGLIGLAYNRYIFDDPSVDITTQLQIYPNLTDFGRVRAQFDARVRYELVNDLFLDFTLYDSYDSDPPSGVASTSDYGVITSLGWSF